MRWIRTASHSESIIDFMKCSTLTTFRDILDYYCNIWKDYNKLLSFKNCKISLITSVELTSTWVIAFVIRVLINYYESWDKSIKLNRTLLWSDYAFPPNLIGNRLHTSLQLLSLLSNIRLSSKFSSFLFSQQLSLYLLLHQIHLCLSSGMVSWMCSLLWILQHSKRTRSHLRYFPCLLHHFLRTAEKFSECFPWYENEKIAFFLMVCFPSCHSQGPDRLC